MKESLRQRVWSRAESACEYCCVPQGHDPLPFGIDHIRPRYHHGPTVSENLSLACFHCNTYKASHIAGYDPETAEMTRLFNPRTDLWDEHFAWDGAQILGTTAIGRTTVDVLRINIPRRIEHRRLLIELGALVFS